MINKRVLIISNNPLSDTNSNGRTLKNFFEVGDKEKLAQFFIISQWPDFDACGSFFCVTDRGVMRSFFKRKAVGKVIVKRDYEERNQEKKEELPSKKQTKKRKKIHKTPLSMLARNFLWNRKKWRGNFYKWVDEFNPEVVFFQAGDSPFLYDLSVNIAKKYNVPLVIYNSEDYYFKDYNYLEEGGFAGICYPIFRKKLKKATQKALDYASLSIYISEDLKNTYDREFNKNSTAIYTSTEVEPCFEKSNEPVFSYLGNLGLDRHVGLIKIANALGEINPEYKLDVYGNASEDVKGAFEECSFINYKGFISYDEVQKTIKNSMLVFHTESFDEFYSKDICHGFSTKIADSLASGTCFVLFAPEHLSCSKYIREKDCGVFIGDEAQLKDKLREVIESEEKRNYYIERAIRVVQENHSAEKNRKRFSEIINNL